MSQGGMRQVEGDYYRRDPKEVRNALAKVFGITFLGGASATVIGGALAYVGSWRVVYFVYGFAEFITAFLMLKMLEKRPGTASTLSLKGAYTDASLNHDLLKTASIIFLMGVPSSQASPMRGSSSKPRPGTTSFWSA